MKILLTLQTISLGFKKCTMLDYFIQPIQPLQSVKTQYDHLKTQTGTAINY